MTKQVIEILNHSLKANLYKDTPFIENFDTNEEIKFYNKVIQNEN
jgi:hypothetical protein